MTRKPGFIIFAFFILLALAGCGGGGDSVNGGGGSPNVSEGFLPGDSASPAMAATTDLAPKAALRSDIVNGVILTKLDVMLASGATVGQVNAALAAVDGTIVHMSAGSPFLTVGVPRQADAAALAALAQALQSQLGIAAAFPGVELAAKALPPGEAGTGPDALFQLEHLLPTRFPAAWNASGLLAGCETAKVPVLIPDFYGEAQPGGFSSQVPEFTPSGTLSEQGDFHGYHVTTTLAAAFDAANPTGAMPFPNCLEFTAIHMGGLSILDGLTKIADEFPSTGKFIVNHSLAFVDECEFNDDDVETCTPSQFGTERIPTPFARAVANLLWRFATDGRMDDFLFVAGAGNEYDKQSATIYSGLARAAFSSAMGLSALSGDQLLTGIQDSALWGSNAIYPSLVATAPEVTHVQTMIDLWGLVTGTDYAPVSNVLTVGSTTRNAAFASLAESAFSDRQPDVMAVGEKVYELGDGLADGTSFSAPQVAGLAAYLWLLSPTLRNTIEAEATAFLIESNTRSNGSVSGVIDAYAAVLSLDPVTPIDVKANIREAILDVDGNGGFDGLDLLKFAEAYHLDDPSAPAPTARDYSRYDLNGDGYTGGIAIDRFDLDRVGSEQFGPALYNIAAQMIEGFEINMNENALSDIQILCYYAYSPLYQGEAGEREDILGVQHCVGAQLEATLAAFSGASAPLNMTVTDETGDPLPGVYLEFAPTGGTVNPPSGITNNNGTFTTTATLDSGSTSLTVVVTARSEPGGEILDQETVTSLAGVVRLIERMHKGTATHFTNAYLLGQFEEIHEVGYAGAADSMEPYSDSSNPSAHTVHAFGFPGTGGIANDGSAEGIVQQSVSFVSDGNGNISSVTGSASFTSQSTVTDCLSDNDCNPGVFETQASADLSASDNYVEFIVEGSPVAYTLSGNLGVTSNAHQSRADGYLSIGLTGFNVCSRVLAGDCVNEMTGEIAPANVDLSSSGVLQPGRHKLSLNLRGDTRCNLGEVLCASTASGSYNFTLTFSPAP